MRPSSGQFLITFFFWHSTPVIENGDFLFFTEDIFTEQGAPDSALYKTSRCFSMEIPTFADVAEMRAAFSFLLSCINYTRFKAGHSFCSGQPSSCEGETSTTGRAWAMDRGSLNPVYHMNPYSLNVYRLLLPSNARICLKSYGVKRSVVCATTQSPPRSSIHLSRARYWAFLPMKWLLLVKKQETIAAQLYSIKQGSSAVVNDSSPVSSLQALQDNRLWQKAPSLF